MRLFVPVTTQFALLTQQLSVTMATIGILYGLYLILLIIGLLFQDHIFLLLTTVQTLLKIAILLFILISVRFIGDMFESGFILSM